MDANAMLRETSCPTPWNRRPLPLVRSIYRPTKGL